MREPRWARSSALVAGALLLAMIAPARARAGGVGALPVISGTPSTEDYAVVAIGTADRVLCTGTMITSRVVLTAAHCLASGGLDTVFVSTDGIGLNGTPIHVIDRRVHPDFDLTALTDDIGLMLLATPAPVAPVAVATTPVGLASGQRVRMVGYGFDGIDPASVGTKRNGEGEILGALPAEISIGEAPAHPCYGDSGGPLFWTTGGLEILVGVISKGDAVCTEAAIAVRTDFYADFIQGYIAETSATGQGVGDGCFDDANCGGARCLAASDLDSYRYCSASCTSEADCPRNMACTGDGGGAPMCRAPLPSPRAMGASCGEDRDCAGAGSVCVGDGTCSLACTPIGEQACPQPLLCVAETGHVSPFACLPLDDSAKVTGGCEVGGGGGAPLAAVLALVGLAVRRRRRGRW